MSTVKEMEVEVNSSKILLVYQKEAGLSKSAAAFKLLAQRCLGNEKVFLPRRKLATPIPNFKGRTKGKGKGKGKLIRRSEAKILPLVKVANNQRRAQAEGGYDQREEYDDEVDANRSNQTNSVEDERSKGSDAVDTVMEQDGHGGLGKPAALKEGQDDRDGHEPHDQSQRSPRQFQPRGNDHPTAAPSRLVIEALTQLGATGLPPISHVSSEASPSFWQGTNMPLPRPPTSPWAPLPTMNVYRPPPFFTPGGKISAPTANVGYQLCTTPKPVTTPFPQSSSNTGHAVAATPLTFPSPAHSSWSPHFQEGPGATQAFLQPYPNIGPKMFPPAQQMTPLASPMSAYLPHPQGVVQASPLTYLTVSQAPTPSQWTSSMPLQPSPHVVNMSIVDQAPSQLPHNTFDVVPPPHQVELPPRPKREPRPTTAPEVPLNLKMENVANRDPKDDGELEKIHHEQATEDEDSNVNDPPVQTEETEPSTSSNGTSSPNRPSGSSSTVTASSPPKDDVETESVQDNDDDHSMTDDEMEKERGLNVGNVCVEALELFHLATCSPICECAQKDLHDRQLSVSSTNGRKRSCCRDLVSKLSTAERKLKAAVNFAIFLERENTHLAKRVEFYQEHHMLASPERKQRKRA